MFNNLHPSPAVEIAAILEGGSLELQEMASAALKEALTPSARITPNRVDYVCTRMATVGSTVEALTQVAAMSGRGLNDVVREMNDSVFMERMFINVEDLRNSNKPGEEILQSVEDYVRDTLRRYKECVYHSKNRMGDDWRGYLRCVQRMNLYARAYWSYHAMDAVIKVYESGAKRKEELDSLAAFLLAVFYSSYFYNGAMQPYCSIKDEDDDYAMFNDGVETAYIIVRNPDVLIDFKKHIETPEELGLNPVAIPDATGSYGGNYDRLYKLAMRYINTREMIAETVAGRDGRDLLSDFDRIIGLSSKSEASMGKMLLD